MGSGPHGCKESDMTEVTLHTHTRVCVCVCVYIRYYIMSYQISYNLYIINNIIYIMHVFMFNTMYYIVSLSVYIFWIW